MQTVPAKGITRCVSIMLPLVGDKDLYTCGYIRAWVCHGSGHTLLPPVRCGCSEFSGVN